MLRTARALGRFRRTSVLARLAGAWVPVLLVVPPAPASEWKAFGLQGVTVRSLEATPDLLCAGTQGYGVYCRRLDVPPSGTSWTPIGPAGVSVSWIWIDPLDTRHRFAAAGIQGTGPSLYRTLDGGANWVPIDRFPNPGGSPPRAWAVHGVPGGDPLFAAGWRVWVSHDLGDTWELSSDMGSEWCLEVAPTDPDAVWAGGETNIFMGFTNRSLDGGLSWTTVWDSHGMGDNQTSDIAAHPVRDGLLLTGHEGFVLRTEDNGETFARPLSAQVRFFLDWDGGNPERAYGGGSPNGGTAQAFVSRDRGRTWSDITTEVIAPRILFRVEADETRTGVVYVATDDGVFRHYGGGRPVCLDTRAGLDALKLRPGDCTATDPDGTGPWPPIPGDAIAFDVGSIRATATYIDLGEVECLVDGGDISFVPLDTPEPAAGRALGVLARLEGATDYGPGSSGQPRRAALGDCR